MDHFRTQISVIYVESLSSLTDFMEDRAQLIHAATNRRPRESESFFGEHDYTSLVNGFFGRYAKDAHTLLIALLIQMVLMLARAADFILFVPLISCPWVVAATVGILFYHFQIDVDLNLDFNSTWRPTTYDWYNSTGYGPQLELQYPMEENLEESNPSEDGRFDSGIAWTRTQHTFYLYLFLKTWFYTNLILLMPIIPLPPTLLGLISYSCFGCVMLFLSYQIYNVSVDSNNLEYD